MRLASMKGKIRKRKVGAGLLFCCLVALLLGACGKEGEKTDAADQVYYHFQEAVIPNPDEALGNVFGQKYGEQEHVILEFDMKLCGDTFYRIAQCYTVEEPLQWGNYIQILKPPYREWITEGISLGYSNLTGILGVDEDRLTVLMYDKNSEEENPYTYYLAYWASGKDLMERVQDSGFGSGKEEFSPGGDFFVTSDGGYCHYDLWGSSDIALYDEKFRLKEKKELGNGVRICGLLQEPESGDLLWYGIKDQEAGVWRLEDGVPMLPAGQSLGTVSAVDFRAAYGADGALYLADTQGLWRMTEGNLEEVCHFFDRDYPMTELYGMEVLEDGSLLLQAKCTDEELALRIEENSEPLPERQEITMASTWTYLYSLDCAIAKFNRISERYHVTTMYPYDGYGNESAEDQRAASEEFRNQLQMEISAGRGPDLYFNIAEGGTINAVDMARGGYLQSLEGVLEDREAYLPSALEDGRIDGVLYGIPYQCSLYLTAYSKDFAGERTSWTLPELMEAVRESDAEALQWGFDGTAIVFYYGLYDNDNKTFIDWEAGESHLNEEPFKEFLEFAREYADEKNDRPYRDEMAADVKAGRVLAVNPNAYGGIRNWGVLWGGDSHGLSLESIFQGKPACIGYPRSDGNGIYIQTAMFYMNANSDNREGVEEFLRYLLSDEVQGRIHREYTVGNLGLYPDLPIRLSALEESIEMARTRKERGEVGSMWRPALTEEQAEMARFLIENARPGSWKVTEVESIIREELEPYFRGQRSLEETVKILDNRVQLYLDEQ